MFLIMRANDALYESAFLAQNMSGTSVILGIAPESILLYRENLQLLDFLLQADVILKGNFIACACMTFGSNKAKITVFESLTYRLFSHSQDWNFPANLSERVLLYWENLQLLVCLQRQTCSSQVLISLLVHS